MKVTKKLTGLSIAAIAAASFAVVPAHSGSIHHQDSADDSNKTTSTNACPSKNCCGSKGNGCSSKSDDKNHT